MSLLGTYDYSQVAGHPINFKITIMNFEIRLLETYGYSQVAGHPMNLNVEFLPEMSIIKKRE